MINGEYRASNQTLSSDDEALNVSHISVQLFNINFLVCFTVSTNQKVPKESLRIIHKKYKKETRLEISYNGVT